MWAHRTSGDHELKRLECIPSLDPYIQAECPSTAVDNALSYQRCDPDWSTGPTAIVCERVWWSPFWTRGFSSGSPASSHINGPLALTSVQTKDIKISCRTSLSIVVNWIKSRVFFCLFVFGFLGIFFCKFQIVWPNSFDERFLDHISHSRWREIKPLI